MTMTIVTTPPRRGDLLSVLDASGVPDDDVAVCLNDAVEVPADRLAPGNASPSWEVGIRYVTGRFANTEDSWLIGPGDCVRRGGA